MLMKSIYPLFAVVFIIAVVFCGGCISSQSGSIQLSQNQITNDSVFSMHVINIGQGDSILLSKDGKYALVDAGKSTQKNDIDSTAAIKKYLNSVGVDSLEFLLVSHQDYDHIGSAKAILSTYPTGIYYDNGFDTGKKTYEDLLTYIDDNNIEYDVVSTGDYIDSPWSDVEMVVLSPEKNFINDDVNDNSVVLKITYGEVSYLLTGDASTTTEEYILSTGADIDVDILKVGHHGSKTASSKAFLKRVSPAVSVISVGEGNSYGHPHKEALNRLGGFTELIYRTDVDGTVVISSDGKTYSVIK